MDDNSTKSPRGRSKGPHRLRRAVVLVLLSVLFFGAGVLLFVRIGLSGDRVAGVVAPGLERALGCEISYSSAHLSWPSPTKARLTVTGLNCTTNSRSPVRFYVPKALFELSFLPLLRGVLLVERAGFFRPVLYLPPTNIMKEEIVSPAAVRSRLGLSILYPVVGDLVLDGGRVVLGSTDPRTPSPTSRAILKDVRVSGKNIRAAGADIVKITGVVPDARAAGQFDIAFRLASTPYFGGRWKGSLRARLSACSLLAVRSLAHCLGAAIPVSKGVVDLNLDMSGGPADCRAKGDLTVSRAVLLAGKTFFSKVPVDRAALRFTGALRGNALSLDLKQVLLPGLNLSAEARVARLGMEDTTLTVAVRSGELDLGKLFPLVPVRLMKDEDRVPLMAAGLNGRIVISGAAWTGKLSELLTEKSWKGTVGINAVLEKVSAFIPGFGMPVKNASGRVRVNPDEMLFEEVRLILGTSPIVLNGAITGLGASPKIDLFVSMEAHGKDVNPILMNRSIAKHLPYWLKSVNEPGGRVALKLDLKGSLKRPAMKGRVSLEGFQFRPEGFPMPLTGINGAMDFGGSGVTLSDVRGHMGRTSARLTGKLSEKTLSLSLEAKVSPRDLRKMKLLPASCKISGKVPLSMKVEGSPSEPKFRAHLNLKANGLRVGHAVRKKPGVPLVLEASGGQSSGVTRIRHATLLTGKGRISARGTIDKQGMVNLTVKLPPKGIQTKHLIPLVDPDLELKAGGRVEGHAIIRAGPDWSGNPRVQADVALSHVSLRPWGFHKAISGLTGTIRMRGDTFNATLETTRIGSSVISGTLSVKGWKKPEVNVKLTSSFLDTTDFTAPPGHVSKVTWGEWIARNSMMRLLARSRGTGEVKIQKGKTPRRAFSDFHADILGNGGLLRAPNWKMSFAGGLLQGSALFDIRADTKTPFTLEFQGDQLKIQRILLTDPERVNIEGDTVVDGKMKWNITAASKDGGVRRTGGMEVRLRNGAIYRFEILSKIFSLINLGSLLSGRLPDVVAHGLPFKRLTWNMEVFGSKWKVKNLKLISDAARIDAEGMYFSEQGRVDFKVDVSPLVGLDAIVSGLFGNLITRNGKILTTTFKIRGLYSSPDVRLEPLESFTSD